MIQLSWAAVGSGALAGVGAGACGVDRAAGFSATGDWVIQLSSGEAVDLGAGAGTGAGFGVNPDLGAGLVAADDGDIQLSWAEGVDLGAGGADLGAAGALDACEIQLSDAEGCERGEGCGGAGRGVGAGAAVPLSNQLPRSGCGWVGSDVWVWLPEAEGAWTDVLEAAARGAGGGGGWEAGCPPNQLSIAEAPDRAAAGGGTGAWWAPDAAPEACRRGGSGVWVGMTMVGSDHAVSLGAEGGFGAGGGAWS